MTDLIVYLIGTANFYSIIVGWHIGTSCHGMMMGLMFFAERNTVGSSAICGLFAIGIKTGITAFWFGANSLTMIHQAKKKTNFMCSKVCIMFKIHIGTHHNTTTYSSRAKNTNIIQVHIQISKADT